MKYARFAAGVALLFVGAAQVAQASSAASASLSFSVLAATGFNWVAAPPSSASADVSAASFAAWSPSAGVFSPVYMPAQFASDLNGGPGVTDTAANAISGAATASAFSFANPASTSATLQASAVVPGSGRADATSFSRAWFSLAPGATVTFQGALFLSASGNNIALPSNYNTGDFYSFASGLLAVGSQERGRDLGGPANTGMTGSYGLNDVSQLSLTISNVGASPLLAALDSGVAVYTASVVPEPETLALLLGGLAAVSFIVRRRSTQS